MSILLKQLQTDIKKLTYIKTPSQIAKMKEAGRIAAKVLEEISPYVKPDVTTRQLDAIAYDLIVNKYQAEIDRADLEGHVYGEYQAVSFAKNEIIFNGEATDIPLKIGDIVGIDVSLKKDGWCGDTQRMWIVGNETSALARMLLAVSYQAMWIGIKLVKPGVHIGTLTHTVRTYVEKHGFSMVEVPSGTGHSIGQEHADGLLIPFYEGEINTGHRLESGMVITIEPFICAGQGKGIRLENRMQTAITEDKSLAAYWEHVVAVTDTGCEILDLRIGESAE